LELVCANSSLIYRVSLRILKNHADAEDNLQNVFIKAYNNIHQFQRRSQLSSWLVSIAINEALMKIRKRKSVGIPRPSETMLQEENSEALKIKDPGLDPERQCINNDLAEKALRSLSASLRDTFILSKAEGWTYREVAGAMGISIGTVKARIFRARARMRQHLGADDHKATDLRPPRILTVAC